MSEHTVTDTDPSAAPRTSRRPLPTRWFGGSLRALRRVFAVLVLGVALVAGSAITATPALANTGATASYCFVHPGGSKYTNTVHIQRHTTQGWTYWGSAVRLPASGCTTVYVPAGQYVRMHAHARVGRVTFSGHTVYGLSQRGRHLNLGTGTVYQY